MCECVARKAPTLMRCRALPPDVGSAATMGSLAQRLRPRGALWGNRDFLWLWSAHTISQFGSETTGLALPLVAILVLDASTPTPWESAARSRTGAVDATARLLEGRGHLEPEHDAPDDHGDEGSDSY